MLNLKLGVDFHADKSFQTTATAQINSHTFLIDLLKKNISNVLDKLIPHYSNVALLDFPNNPNVGDSLIWLGEIAYLKSRHISIQYVCDSKNYDAYQLRQVLDTKTIILIHGGGNFGTLWPEEQAFREQVLLDFANTPCIQLPQSIYFDNKEATTRAAKIINAHNNYTILTRDKASYEFVLKSFKSTVYMCPDMAFFMKPQIKSSLPVNDCLVLARHDHERSSEWAISLPAKMHGISYQICDWLNASFIEKIIYKIETHSVVLRLVVDKNNLILMWLWNQLATLRLKRGAALLERGQIVLTDRLHAHILCLLLDIPHLVVDNANKKISAFYQVWTKSYINVRFINDDDCVVNEIKKTKNSILFSKTTCSAIVSMDNFC